MSQRLILSGQYGSPYTLKMRAVLRYRHIAFKWVLRDSKWDDLPEVPVRIIPVIVFPGPDGEHGEAMVDSSPLIMRLESEYSQRRVVPADPALALVDALIEDFADEWLTKAMYHYRWAYAADIDKAAKLLPLSQNLQLDDDRAARMYRFIADRQIGRRPLVGSTDANQAIIEESYHRVLDILQSHFGARDFLIGERPGRGDFAMYGQLSQLVKWEPTSTTVAVERAPRVINWVERVDDLSWWELGEGDDTAAAGWLGIGELGTTIDDLLAEIGRTYAPFMVANARALASGAEQVVCQIDGHDYRQAPFKYQAKCLQWLREDYEALDPAARGAVDAALAGTGCEVLFA